MYVFISGFLAAMCFAVALFFLRFWRTTGDGLFLAFSTAFALLGIERVLLSVIRAAEDSVPFAYLPRLIAFVIIIVAIVAKNRNSSRA